MPAPMPYTTPPVATTAETTWRDYYELGKPRVVALIVFTAIVGMFLAGGVAAATGGAWAAIGSATTSCAEWCCAALCRAPTLTRTPPLPPAVHAPAPTPRRNCAAGVCP